MDDCTWRLFYCKKWLDLYQLLGDNYQSMESWLNKIGLQKSESGVKGRQIPELYKNKEYAKIERYIVDELHKCETLFLQLEQEYPYSRPDLGITIKQTLR